MNREDIDIMWNKALQQAIKDGEEFTRYHFAALVAAAERNRTWTQEHWTEYERSIAAAEREEMVALAAKQGWAMKNEDPFEDAVREIAAIRARKENT